MRSGLRRPSAPNSSLFRAPLGAAVALACLLTTACGNEQESTATTTQVDLAALEVGNYPTEAVALGKATTDEQAALVEAQRLAEVVPLPREIDPALNYARQFNQSRTFTDVSIPPISRELLLSRERFDAVAPGFISGHFSQARTHANANLSWEMANYILLYSDADAAKQAVPAIAAEHRQALGDKYTETRIDKYPDARATWTSTYDALYVWHSIGRFLILTVINDHLSEEIGADDLPGLTAHASQVIGALPAGLEKFQPTPREQWSTLDRDIDGLLSMAVPAANDGGATGTTVPAVYQRRGALHVAQVTDKDEALFDETGVDLVAFNGGALYRAKDPASAQLLADRRAQLGRLYVIAPGPTGLPSANCHESREEFRGSTPRFHCSIAVGRYAAEIGANQLADAHQRISAQYALLAEAE
ncbi:hypothetical protein ACFXK0_21245 [Nocardia sp. NPDC059177]|uniref:DUF7373 family lipoprotein n=1 Tax=Nocardia sp. NPDC059177 TaxID=3346759 RepID=UPI0036915DAD